jgi:putative inorganic carbon (hco3(-)) transporter
MKTLGAAPRAVRSHSVLGADLRPTRRIRASLSASAIGVGVGVVLGLVAGQAATRGSVVSYLAVLLAAAPFVAILVGGLRRFLVAAVVLDIALRWDITLFSHGLGPSPGGLNVSVTTIAVAGLYAMWLADALSPQTLAPRPPFRAFALPFFYLLLTALSLTVATEKLVGLFNVALLVQTFLVFAFVVSTVRDWPDFRFIMVLLTLAVFIESNAVIVSYLVGHDFAFAGLTGYAYGDPDQTSSIYRPGGTIGSPNVAGTFLGVSLAPVLVLLKTPISHRVRIFAAVSFCLGIFALILTFSRGGWLAFITSMIVIVVASRVRPIFNIGTTAILFLLSLLIILPFRDVILARLNDSTGADSRVPLMQIAWQIVGDHPFFGIGVNNYFFALPNYAGPEFTGEWLAIVHNQFLLVWAEAGVFTLLAFVAFLVSVIWRGWRAITRANDPLGILAVGLTASMVGMLPNMFVERFVNRPQIGLLWLIAALLTAISLTPSTTQKMREPSTRDDSRGSKQDLQASRGVIA